MSPLFSRILPAMASAYSLQTVLAIIFVPQANEKYYDFGGAAGFLSTTLVSLYYPSLRAKFWDRIPDAMLPNLTSFAPRQLLLSACVGVWSVRLGTFLATRAIKAGGDSRFDQVKHQPSKFAFYWFAQATWVFLVGLPVYLVNSLPVSAHPPLGPRDYLSTALFAASWLFEIVADHQKTTWRRRKNNKEHDEKFITGGLWSLSRHPNYVGEVGLWTGIWALSTASLGTAYFPHLTWLLAGISPITTYFLIRRVSGVPPLELELAAEGNPAFLMLSFVLFGRASHRAAYGPLTFPMQKAGDKKFTGPEWEHYKRSVLTPVYCDLLLTIAYLAYTLNRFVHASGVGRGAPCLSHRGCDLLQMTELYPSSGLGAPVLEPNR
ncbi:hypothetical protein NM688_g3052 [Phlebia brevispora]|uniref:Uncharacterized protein n=1 Tax=Phlebia brevispora TaxID=194682 RepID=A0ACC1T6X3_9APHY|nr:hypothetical protein NM688_g3052 [Phlebia brevispora]